MGPPHPGPLLNRPVGDNCNQRGKPSQANRGPKKQVIRAACCSTRGVAVYGLILEDQARRRAVDENAAIVPCLVLPFLSAASLANRSSFNRAVFARTA